MERDPRFVQLYNSIMIENKAELENLRKRSKVKIIGLIIICIIFPIFLFTLFGKSALHISVFLIPIIVCIIVLIAKNITNEKKSSSYTSVFKTKVILPLIQHVFNSAEYSPNKQLSRTLYNNDYINVYKDNYDNYYSEDAVITKDANDLVFAEVKLDREVQTKNGKEKVLVFWGLAGNFKSPIDFNSPIRILRDSFYNGDVKMDSSEFEENFNVYTRQKITTLSILTADVMTKLVDLKKKFGKSLEIVFFADKVYFRIDYSNLFEAELNREALSVESIEKYYNLLCNIKDMSEYIVEVLKNANI